MKVELMRYRNDKVSFWMNILAIIFNLVFMVVFFSNRAHIVDPSDPDKFLTIIGVKAGYDKAWGGANVGIDILYCIIFMLFAFLTAEKVKSYALNWCFVSAVLGALQVLRIYIVVLPFHAQEHALADGTLQLGGASFYIALISLVASAIVLFIGTYTSFVNSHKLDKYVKELNESGEVA